MRKRTKSSCGGPWELRKQLISSVKEGGLEAPVEAFDGIFPGGQRQRFDR